MHGGPQKCEVNFDYAALSTLTGAMSSRPKRAGAGVARPIFDPSSSPSRPKAKSHARPDALKAAPSGDEALAADDKAKPVPSVAPIVPPIPVVVVVAVGLPAPADLYSTRAAAAFTRNGAESTTAGRAKSDYALVRVLSQCRCQGPIPAHALSP